MRKILIFATVAYFTFFSCKKETAIEAPGISQTPQTLSTSTVSASGILTEPLGVNLAGFQLLELCSNQIWTTVSGTVVFYMGSDKKVKALGVYNFVFRDGNATIYRGEYSVSLEPFTWFGEVSTTYKLILNPRSGNINKVVLALVQVNAKENGVYSVQIESGTIECR